VHASTVTTLVVDEDEAFGTFFTNVAKDVVLTTQNVDVALTLKQMVKVSALVTSASVLGGLLASDQAGLRVGLHAQSEHDSSKQ